MTRVLVIESGGGLWGSERALLDLLDAFEGLEIAVCCPPATDLFKALSDRGVRTYPWLAERLHERSWLRPKAALGLLRAALAFRPDVIYLNQGGVYRLALPTANLLGLRMVAHMRLFEEIDYLAAHRPDPRRLSGVIAVSGAVADQIRRQPGLQGLSVHRICDPYRPIFEGQDDFDRPRSDQLACVSRIEPMKGQALLIQALSRMADNSRGLTCQMVGAGDPAYVESLQKLSRQDTRVDVQWMGYSKDVPSLMRQFSVLAFPSERETLGRVILEAWDAGVVPVVFAGSGGAAEIVKASGGGVLFEERTAASLASALERALHLPAQERRRMVEAGRAWTAANCRPAACAQAMAAILVAAATEKAAAA